MLHSKHQEQTVKFAQPKVIPMLKDLQVDKNVEEVHDLMLEPLLVHVLEIIGNS